MTMLRGKVRLPNKIVPRKIVVGEVPKELMDRVVRAESGTFEELLESARKLRDQQGEEEAGDE